MTDTIQRYIDRIKDLEGQIAFKDQTNAVLQSRLVGETKLREEIADLKDDLMYEQAGEDI